MHCGGREVDEEENSVENRKVEGGRGGEVMLFSGRVHCCVWKSREERGRNVEGEMLCYSRCSWCIYSGGGRKKIPIKK